MCLYVGKPEKLKMVNAGKKITAGVLILAVGMIVYFLVREKIFFADVIVNINTFLSSFGILAPLVYILFLALAIIVSQIPNIPLAIAAGIMFGPYLGFLYTLMGGMLGAMACFYIARTVGVTVIKKIFGKVPRFTEHTNERYIGLLLFFVRLFPFFSFDLMSFCAGLTNIRGKTFFTATLFGMMPMTFLLTYLGGLPQVDHDVSSGPGKLMSLSIILNIIFIVFFISVPIVIKRFNVFNLNKYIEIK